MGVICLRQAFGYSSVFCGQWHYMVKGVIVALPHEEVMLTQENQEAWCLCFLVAGSHLYHLYMSWHIHVPNISKCLDWKSRGLRSSLVGLGCFTSVSASWLSPCCEHPQATGSWIPPASKDRSDILTAIGWPTWSPSLLRITLVVRQGILVPLNTWLIAIVINSKCIYIYIYCIYIYIQYTQHIDGIT